MSTIAKKLYARLISPLSSDVNTRNREVILNLLLVGTLFLCFAALLVLLVELLIQEQTYVAGRLGVCSFVTAFMLFLYLLSRSKHYYLASYLFVATVFLITGAMIFIWGIQIPQGILLAAYVIILSGILLGSRHAIYAAVLNIALLTGVFVLGTPDTTWKQTPAVSGDIVVYGATFALIAAVCWLYDSQIERSLQRAERSEAALRRQKQSLEVTVEQRTKKLQAVQVEQIQQVYRFAELGLVSTSLLHDLANHMSAISLDIKGLEGESNSEILERIQRTVTYIDDTVQKTRVQLHGQTSSKRFDAMDALQDVVHLLSYRAERQAVQLEIDAPEEKIHLVGDEMRFKQLLTNLIGNGIDAYEGVAGTGHKTTVQITTTPKHLTIAISDRGRGIPEKAQKYLFEPFYTTKKQGMGLGLFMAKEIAEKGFGGHIIVTSGRGKATVFRVTFPYKKK